LSSVESQFLESEDLSRYRGKWIAILDKKIVADGETMSGVYEKVMKKSIVRTPLYQRIPKKGEVDTFIL